MPLLILAGGPRAGETFRTENLSVEGYSVQSFDGRPDMHEATEADVVVMVHNSIHGVDQRMKVGHAAWTVVRDAGQLPDD